MKLKHIVVYAVFVLAVLGILYSISGQRAPRIPDTEWHQDFSNAAICPDCHSPGGKEPLPSNHPPKTNCPECHTVKDDRLREKG